MMRYRLPISKLISSNQILFFHPLPNSHRKVVDIIEMSKWDNSLANQYIFNPMQVYIGLRVILPIVGVVWAVDVVWEGVVGEVDVSEGLVTLYKEMHVDVGVVIERLVAL